MSGEHSAVVGEESGDLPGGVRDSGLPEGFSVVVDVETRLVNAGTLVGGSPPKIPGPASSVEARLLARQLTDGNVAHPRPPASAPVPEVTVVVPVRDRPRMPRQRCRWVWASLCGVCGGRIVRWVVIARSLLVRCWWWGFFGGVGCG